ncbi:MULTISPECIES: type II toxin-antitoxin system HicB family antitoxin [Haloarcula]|uniref:Uncharacterized protein n=2 Tax=Haloarcula sebkhae TaxID=932660 RepID=A0ACC6VRK5_9EURY|nr:MULTISPECIES: hypothetical protein [Haloarcula]GGK78783.1 hypothetical protein GCM10009067_33880 [Haloarcula sebkhae]
MTTGVQNQDGDWTARHLQVDISAEGGTRGFAVENLMAVVAAVTGDDEPTDAELNEFSADSDVVGHRATNYQISSSSLDVARFCSFFPTQATNRLFNS